jgi:hypothetical protein
MKRYLSLVFLFGLSLSASAQTCTTFPCVVASVSLTNQSQRIAPTPIFTPPASGVFRVSAYMSASTGPKNAEWELFVSWTDDLGLKFSVLDARENGFNDLSLVVQAVGGQPLLYQTGHTRGGLREMTYNLFITVEQLE